SITALRRDTVTRAQRSPTDRTSKGLLSVLHHPNEPLRNLLNFASAVSDRSSREIEQNKIRSESHQQSAYITITSFFRKEFPRYVLRGTAIPGWRRLGFRHRRRFSLPCARIHFRSRCSRTDGRSGVGPGRF